MLWAYVTGNCCSDSPDAESKRECGEQGDCCHFFFFFHGYGLEPRLTKNHGVVVSMRLMQFMFGVFRRNQVLTSNLLESKYPINY